MRWRLRCGIFSHKPDGHQWARGNQAASCRRRWAVCMMVWAGAGGRMATGLTIVAIALASFAATPAMREVGVPRPGFIFCLLLCSGVRYIAAFV